MAAKPAPVPCPRCSAPVGLFPQDGGRGSGMLTSCGLKEEYFGHESGRKDAAIREWNRWVKAQANKLSSAA